MSKKIKVIIKANKFKEQKRGTIIKVTHGYAFNYLIPNDIVEVATMKKLKHFSLFAQMEEQKHQADLIKNARKQKAITHITRMTMYKKKGDSTLIFGSIKDKDINDWMTRYTNIKIDKKDIALTNINQIGTYLINIESKDSSAIPIQLYILPNNI